MEFGHVEGWAKSRAEVWVFKLIAWVPGGKDGAGREMQRVHDDTEGKGGKVEDLSCSSKPVA